MFKGEMKVTITVSNSLLTHKFNDIQDVLVRERLQKAHKHKAKEGQC